MDTRTAFALHKLELITGEELTRVATEVLMSGSDSPATRQLAGLIRPTMDEAAPLFLAMAREQGLEEPETLAAALIAGVVVAEKVGQGEVEAREGAALFERIWQASGYPPQLSALATLYDEYAWDDPRDPEAIDADVLSEARLLIERHGND